jgi:hypothetical protein
MSDSPAPDRPGDAGSAAVSIAIIFPAIAVLFLAMAQAVMVAAAHDVALSAAEEGLRVARAHHSTLPRGRTAATAFARHEPVLVSPRVAVSGTRTVTVTVHGNAPSLLPGVHLVVSGTARGACEVFTTESQQP